MRLNLKCRPSLKTESTMTRYWPLKMKAQGQSWEEAGIQIQPFEEQWANNDDYDIQTHMGLIVKDMTGEKKDTAGMIRTGHRKWPTATAAPADCSCLWPLSRIHTELQGQTNTVFETALWEFNRWLINNYTFSGQSEARWKLKIW